MPRDASGNYTLPAGNPVVSGTIITSIWANATMPDLGDALTDSLSRSGQGGMLVPLRVGDGTVDEPAFSFSTEISLGMYRVSAGILGFPVAGTLRASVSSLLDQPMDVFTNEKWPGFLLDGTHVSYVDDLDDIDFNSFYHFSTSFATNFPPDMLGHGVIRTDVLFDAPTFVTQVIYGLNSTSVYKIWMRNREGNGFNEWKLIADGGAFTERLAGYDDDQRHDNYSGDLDEIVINSGYSFFSGNVTNLPSDFTTGNAIILTNMNATSDSDGTQRLISMNISNIGDKQWMRIRVSDVWQAWILVIDGGAMTLRYNGFLDTGLHMESVNDLDTVLTNSIYITNPNVTNTPTDFDTVNRGFLVTQMHLTTHGMQILWGRSSTNAWKTWIRPYHSNVWDEWKLVVDGGAFTLRLPGFLDTGFTENFIETGETDVDNVFGNSQYSVSQAVQSNLPPDMIAGGIGILVTLFHGGVGNAQQVLYDNQLTGVKDTSRVFMRIRRSNIWGAWNLVIDGGAFTERLAGYNDNGLHATYTGDLDDIIVNAAYSFLTTDVTNEPADMPAGTQGVIKTNWASNQQAAIQVIYGVGSIADLQAAQWQRTSVSGVWQNWNRVVDGNQLDFSNDLMVTNLPTSDPVVSGALWNNGGVVNVST